MAIGRISGPMLYSNLDRQGANLTVDTDLLHFDVVNRRLGISTVSPGQDLDVPGNVRLASLSVLGNAIVSNTGKINLGTTSNVVITGGSNYDVLYTDGQGNLQFINLNDLNNASGELTGNAIPLGPNSSGTFTSNALTFTTLSSVTDSIAELNEVLGFITNSDGSVITTTNIHGTLQTNAQPYVNSLGTLTNLTIDGDLIVYGNTTLEGYTNLTIQDSIINLHTTANLAPLTSDDGRDVGLVFHYYKTQNDSAFLGWANDTGYLEWYDSGVEVNGNVFTGNSYGTIKAGEIWLSNTTPSTSTTTGVLRIDGGAGIQGNVNAGNVSASTGVFTSINGNLPAPYVQGTVNTANVTLYISSESTGINNTFYPVFVDKLTGNVAEYTNSALSFNPSTGYLTSTRFVGQGYFSALQSTNFSSGNVYISGGYINDLANVTASVSDFDVTTTAQLNSTSANLTTAVATNFSSGNAQITGGDITNTPVSGSTGHFTTLQGTDFSTGNAVISGGYFTGLANIAVTTGYVGTLNSDQTTVVQLDSTSGNVVTLTAENFSSGNVYIAGGYINDLANVTAGISDFDVTTTGQLNTTSANVGTLVTTNFSSGNIQVIGGDISDTPVSGSTGHFTTLQGTDFSSGNVYISGGYIDTLTNATIATTNTSLLNATNSVIYSLNNSFGNITTLVATNFSSPNVVISGGYISAMANVNSVIANFNTTTTTNLNSTNGNVTTLVAQNFSSGNIQVTGGYLFAPVVSGTVATANISLYERVQSSTSNEIFYPAFYNTTTGNAATYTSLGLTFNPGTGNLTVTNFVGNVFGKIITEAQPYITTVGNLIYLNVDQNATITGNVISGNVITTQVDAELVGNVLTSAQPYITSLGSLISLDVTGNITVDSVIGEFYGNVYTDSIVAQTSNITLTPQDAFVIVNSQNGVVMPVGNTAQRPVGLEGTLRYNTTLGTMEFYNGSSWVPFTNTVQSQQFSGDGGTQTFTLDYDADQDTILVSINGTLQEPGVAYTVVGDQITFAEIPQATDVISVRFIASLSSPSGGQQFQSVTASIIPALDSTYDIGSNSKKWKDLYINNINATGILKIDQVQEKFFSLTNQSGTVSHDCSNGHVFYHYQPTGSITVNLLNLDLSAAYATAVTLVIEQGATAYMPTAVQINGVTQTIKWQSGTIPSGNANGVDVVGFSILNSSGNYVVLGQASTFG